jgi:hypothetical protein
MKNVEIQKSISNNKSFLNWHFLTGCVSTERTRYNLSYISIKDKTAYATDGRILTRMRQVEPDDGLYRILARNQKSIVLRRLDNDEALRHHYPKSLDYIMEMPKDTPSNIAYLDLGTTYLDIRLANMLYSPTKFRGIDIKYVNMISKLGNTYSKAEIIWIDPENAGDKVFICIGGLEIVIMFATPDIPVIFHENTNYIQSMPCDIPMRISLLEGRAAGEVEPESIAAE